ncbi:hypothetical protein PQO01_03835 [Lentisphaera marina]|uniref:hypothetical protein n=1 Tax=Lentisphaera marina TaxID=1111041 RepID=UPI002366B23E|nr:hypothetical protein [Lentisphaera marina]MDD7984081.1 hypothetical protein [Lentisphaera marina]
MTTRFYLALLFISVSINSALSLEVIINSEKSADVNQSIFLQLTKFPNELYVENPKVISDKILDAVLADNTDIVIGDKTLLISDITAEANKQARANAEKLHPTLDKKKLVENAEETFPIYKEGDYVEFVYDPFRKIAVKGKIKRISNEFLFVGFSGQYAIKNILDPALRDSFFPDKVKTNRQKYIDTLIAKQRYQFNVTLNKNVQPIADKLILQNEKNGFIYVNSTWHLISDLINSRVNDKNKLITKKLQVEQEKLDAAEAARKAEEDRVNNAKLLEAQKLEQARLDKEKAEAENAKRIAELQGDLLTEEDKLKEQAEMLKKLEEEEAEAAKVAAAKRAAKAAKKRALADSGDSDEDGPMAGFQVIAIALIVILGLAVVAFVVFKDKINKKFKRNKITLDQISGEAAPAPSTKMPEEEAGTGTKGPSLTEQAEASRDAGDGSKIQKKKISFSKSKPGNSSNFFSPEEIEQSEEVSTDTASVGRSQAISMSSARPGNSSKSPITPPGGGLTPPGGGLTPPGGGLTPPGGGLTPPPAQEEADDSSSSLITDPSLKPKPKLQLKK